MAGKENLEDLLDKKNPGQKSQEQKPKGNDRIQSQPTRDIGILIKYVPGRKEEAIQEAFEILGDGQGLLCVVASVGLSRRYSWKEFPKTNAYVPRHEMASRMFVKFEPLS